MRANIAIPSLFLLFGLSASSYAQNCAAPLQISSVGSFSGNTCTSTNNLPFLANGAISTPGEDEVYHFATSATATSPLIATLTPQANVDLALFVCRGPCSTYSTCIAAVDGGAGMISSAQIPAGSGDYFIIVGSTGQSTPSCGTYTLTLAGPLND